jgi:ankyrin repeat protein
MNLEQPVDAFVVAATSQNETRARRMLAAQPEIAADPWAALVLGRPWRGDPNAPAGPRGWAPLLYACHSPFASAGVVRDLLDRGADPNAYFVNEYGRMSALYGAAGVVHDPERTRLLLEAGADPNDGESPYHSIDSPSTACLELLLSHGAAVDGTNALARALDESRYDHVKLMLDAGGDAGGPLVAHAVRRGCGPELIRLLVEHGGDVDGLGGETWRGDVPLRTPYQHAIIRGRDDLAEVLAELGASTDVAPEDRSVAAIARGETPPVPLPRQLDPDAQEVVIMAALEGHVEVVLATFGPEFRGVVGGSPEGTLLHHAAWVGDAAVVRLLLERGAHVDAASGAEFDTPLAWAVLASQYHALPGRDYVAVGEALVAAGAVIEPGFTDVAEGPLHDWLDDEGPS